MNKQIKHYLNNTDSRRSAFSMVILSPKVINSLFDSALVMIPIS